MFVTLNSMFNSEFKIGSGYDRHILVKGNKIILGNVIFNDKYTIVAHSDGDVVLHSIVDAILGALSLDDIGTYFPDSEVENKDRNSIEFLNFALNKMNKDNYIISNIDITVVCNQIILKDKKLLIKDNLINLLDTKNISIKATRFEEDSEVIEVQTILLLRKN